MKLVSYLVSGRASFGLLTQHGIVDLGKKLGDKYTDLKSLLADEKGLAIAKTYLNDPSDIDEKDITYLPVIPNPNKILCVGMNYAEKRAEFNETSSAPTLFVRFPDSQTGHKTNIIKPAITNELDYEGELAIVIGKSGFRIKQEDALSYVAGYSCYMDGSIRDWQYTWFTAGKNWPSTGAFGPCLTTTDEIPDPKALTLVTYLNGQEMQRDSVNNLVHTVPELISYISTFTHLSPGDVILTGSPGGVGKKRNPPIFMKDGDKIEVEITGIGRLTNYVVAEK
ncbi:fumarylacetoacetate hydrolase family protein [Frischella perrara]|jgi:2-keto-4-pentenoate hydratase/2-oxohepta-3-ene-1,7-dioic acid hydratase (catechol pathway)|uniref:2-keto-4-pentenoate hydratase/2-oxohepta-3-ene-1,7-dioic acid hydratase (Catechol pathway) n=1 Tax=Frischella perrara TaxID=1267021 RepID=A0A0A7RYL6_FRIPE|nr:fumarylacetoacetate hydrolase family protein [Frischella perrara]AJA44343.1 2-keto-4-pentenoate hydratase/2-oxohepta-3-ene-1,7-dioic acid hydratase (catechol pathway) [Frischella perrara]MCT6876259.1 fumarylacetoacetate hydrolase family protein [Frischella perrara]PWV64029.1 2-keto-4-pentenoate hydratase/2-oxohepta-3-ene-1,7-dioic acid hydratase in catechol pathway [Frischella perrara]PXY96666.1 FAA hydrolase family protein [Frischella perrara]